MEFKRFEALIEMFPQVQIFSTEGEDLDRVITHFLNQRNNVSTMSEAMQRKIQHALAPFFQQRFISLHDEEAPLVRHLLLKKSHVVSGTQDLFWPGSLWSQMWPPLCVHQRTGKRSSTVV